MLANLFSKISTTERINDDENGSIRERLESPILNSKLEENMRLLFDGLVNHIQDAPTQFRDKTVQHDDDIEAVELYGKFNDHIHRLLSMYPVLARVVMIQGADSRKSLLAVACQNLQQHYSYPAIQFLIAKNPSSLLWKQNNAVRTSSPICTIARTPSLCGLMPWIAEHYAWVLDHPICVQSPPALLMTDLCADGTCKESIVEGFFTRYPQGLLQDDSTSKNGLPIHRLVRNGRGLFDMQLFKWMVEKSPDSLLYQDMKGQNILHHCSVNAAEAQYSYAEDILDVFQFVIAMRPDLSRKMDNYGILPIHILLKSQCCHHRILLEMAILLLIAHPESYDISSIGFPSLAPKDISLMRVLYPLLLEQKELKANIELLTIASDNIRIASQATGSQEDATLLSAVSSVFQSWTTLQIQVLEGKLEHIVSELETAKSTSRSS